MTSLLIVLISCYFLYLAFELFALWLQEPIMAIGCRLVIIISLRVVWYLRQKETHLYDELTLVMVMVIMIETATTLLLRGAFTLYSVLLIWPVIFLLVYLLYGEEISAYLSVEKGRNAPLNGGSVV